MAHGAEGFEDFGEVGGFGQFETLRQGVGDERVSGLERHGGKSSVQSPKSKVQKRWIFTEANEGNGEGDESGGKAKVEK